MAGRLFDSSVGRSFLLVPPADVGLRRVEVLDGAGKPLRAFVARLPPARRQCGYDFALYAEQARNAQRAIVSPKAASSQLSTLLGRTTKNAMPGLWGSRLAGSMSYFAP